MARVVNIKLGLTHSAPEYFEKLALKKAKIKTLIGYISRHNHGYDGYTHVGARNVTVMSTLVHSRGLRPQQPPVPLPAARSAQRVKD